MAEKYKPLVAASGRQPNSNSDKLLDEQSSAQGGLDGTDIKNAGAGQHTISGRKTTFVQKTSNDPLGRSEETVGGRLSQLPSDTDIGSVPTLKLREIQSSQRETAAYIHDMSIGMRDIASDSGMTFLAYLLDMAAEQAESTSHYQASQKRNDL